jgi:hypothetical protein
MDTAFGVLDKMELRYQAGLVVLQLETGRLSQRPRRGMRLSPFFPCPFFSNISIRKFDPPRMP